MIESYQQQLKKGLLILALLKLIGARRVYVADMLQELSRTEFITQEGTLYPLLAKMKREGLLDHTWVESSGGPPRKYYSLTPQGQAMADTLSQYLQQLQSEISKLG